MGTIRNICLIGATGSGKSLTACGICGKIGQFKFGNTSTSVTNITKGVISKWRGSQSSELFIITDTPGLGDSGNKDTANIAKMVCTLQQLGYVHSFVIVFNS